MSTLLRTVARLLLPFLVLAPTARAQSTSPTFDCTKASGEVETLICKDAALAALDRQLDGVFKAALGKASAPLARTLRTEQRGWIGGRNECWKAQAATPTYLTESVTANSVRGCVEITYKMRIAELQAVWRLVPVASTTTYQCGASPADELVATYFATDPKTARLERGDTTITTYSVPTGSGIRYEGRNVRLMSKGPESALMWMNGAGEIQNLTCKAK